MASDAAGRALRKVTIVNTADRGGGAERIAMTLLDGFEARGTETWLAVGAKQTNHPRVMALHLSPHVDYSADGAPARRLARAARRRVARRIGLEDFDHPYTRHLLGLTGSRPDLVLCDNLHGGYFDLRALSRLSHELPVVVKLSDSWLLTGHCASPRGCPRWETGCGSCPDLTIPPAVERDATALNWRRKRRVLAGARLFVCSPSHWLMERARRSLLATAIEGDTVIPNGIDLDTMAPGSREAARRELGIDPDAHVLVFVANAGADNPYKDFAVLREAVRVLAAAAAPRAAAAGGGARLELLIVGKLGADEPLAGGGRIRHLPYEGRRSSLAGLYRAADLYVHAAPEEAFSLTTAEALACGTPVVAAAEGGIREVVDHDHTGLLVPPGAATELAAALRALLEDPERRRAMGHAAAAVARERFDGTRMVDEIYAWCAEVAARWSGSSRPAAA